MQYNLEDINNFIENQLVIWPLAKKNYDDLQKVERREVYLGKYRFFVQFNPARIISTGADIDKKVIAKRPCFLCKDNRPKEQLIAEIIPGWDMLVNPYPIFPVHLTIVAQRHIPQNSVPKDIVEIASMLPGMVIFFNGAKAGASAPDHLHLQAVLKDELPLINIIEKVHPESIGGVLPSDGLLPGFPFFFFTGVVQPDERGMKPLLAGLSIGGSSAGDRIDDHELVNTFFWIGKEGKLRFIAIPRKAHRPSCYHFEGLDKRLVSPGCIDMAGIIVAPRLEDYKALSPSEVSTIYNEVAFEAKK